MVSTKRKYKFSKELFQELLLELWENATFSNHSYNIIKSLTSKVNKEAIRKNLPLEDVFFELSTLRNRHLIETGDQEQLKNSVVAFFGMSVGSHAAITWMLQSRADIVKIIDPDTISPSNLNRLKFGWDDVGKKKVDVVKEQLKVINPFTKVLPFYKGDKEEIEDVVEEPPKVDLIVDEIDDIQSKAFLRKIAKKYRIPLVQAADVGDNVFLDIERYDIDPQPEIFLGRIPEVKDIDFDSLSEKERIKLIVKHVGLAENSEAMLYSLLEIGETLATWPQLGATATISGGVVATAIKKIVLGEEIESGRYYVSLDKILVKDFDSNARKSKRSKLKDKIKRKLGF